MINSQLKFHGGEIAPGPFVTVRRYTFTSIFGLLSRPLVR